MTQADFFCAFQVESMKVSIERQQREMAERHERASQDLLAIQAS